MLSLCLLKRLTVVFCTERYSCFRERGARQRVERERSVQGGARGAGWSGAIRERGRRRLVAGVLGAFEDVATQAEGAQRKEFNLGNSH